MNQYILLYILIVHWIADFVLQTHTEATNKSTSWYWLLKHTLKYTYTLWVCGVFYVLFNIRIYQPWSLTYFCIITFLCHTATDYFTSKLARRYFSVGNYHNGFVVVGFDQILHYIQLYLTFKYLLI